MLKKIYYKKFYSNLFFIIIIIFFNGSLISVENIKSLPEELLVYIFDYIISVDYIIENIKNLEDFIIHKEKLTNLLNISLTSKLFKNKIDLYFNLKIRKKYNNLKSNIREKYLNINLKKILDRNKKYLNIEDYKELSRLILSGADYNIENNSIKTVKLLLKYKNEIILDIKD